MTPNADVKFESLVFTNLATFRRKAELLCSSKVLSKYLLEVAVDDISDMGDSF